MNTNADESLHYLIIIEILNILLYRQCQGKFLGMFHIYKILLFCFDLFYKISKTTEFSKFVMT
jgi:hypothetical protein